MRNKVINLLEETIEAIKESGHSIEDIIFIGSEQSGHSCTWDEFCVLANREYDNCVFVHTTSNCQKVAVDLIITFNDYYRMIRGIKNKYECWGYIKPFKTPYIKKGIKNLFNDLWSGTDLAHINLEA